VSRTLEVAAEHQLDGVIGKRVDSAYRSGRSQAWRKLPLRRATEVVVVGWLFREELQQNSSLLLMWLTERSVFAARYCHRCNWLYMGSSSSASLAPK